MYEVLGAVIDLQGKWTDILAGLRLPPSLQSTIKAEHSTNTRSCLQAVLLVWLSKSYDVEKHGFDHCYKQFYQVFNLFLFSFVQNEKHNGASVGSGGRSYMEKRLLQ